MSMAWDGESGKVSVLVELTEELGKFVQQAAAEGRPLRDVERSVLRRSSRSLGRNAGATCADSLNDIP